MSANPDSVSNQGEFHSSVPPAKPMTTKGHELGQQVGNESAPEFRAKTFPPGTAPSEHAFNPNPVSSVPGQAGNPDMDESSRTGALDMPGATSQSVYNQNTMGQPIQGQTRKEVETAYSGKNSTERIGLAGTGAPTVTGEGSVEQAARKKRADLPEGVERRVTKEM